jgi:hypothetical protein
MVAPMRRTRVLVLLSSFTLSACKKEPAPMNDPSRASPPAADVPELEVRSGGIDRFTVCPPPGDLGQQWIPPLPAWAPPPAPPGATAADETLIAQSAGRSLTEIAASATHRDFRSCYRRGLVHHPMEDGRVAIVLRVGRDGRVVRVESYAACELAVESIACMYGVAQKLRFPPPAEGAETVTIPAVFTSRDGVRRTVATSNDAYTAAAYVTLEGARPALHSCEENARRDGQSVFATGTFTMTLDPNGRVQKAHVDPWTGDKSLLACAARALETLTFAPPRGGRGTVITRLNFNPRQGGR